MLNHIKKRLHNRQHAGHLLADKLNAYRNSSDAIVLAIPHGGIPVGHEMATSLAIPFEIIFSKRIKHPAHSEQSIGAVSMDEVVLHDSTQFIPQSYVLQQINQLQRNLHEQFHRYYGNKSKKSITGKTVILVDDVLRDIEELTACLHTIEKQEPAGVIVAAAVSSARVAHYLAEANYPFHYLFLEVGQQSKAYTYFPEVNEEETRSLFNSSLSFSTR
jgi:predicted phosphoribosyltransferase